MKKVIIILILAMLILTGCEVKVKLSQEPIEDFSDADTLLTVYESEYFNGDDVLDRINRLEMKVDLLLTYHTSNTGTLDYTFGVDSLCSKPCYAIPTIP